MEIEPAVRDEYITLGGMRFHYRDWGDRAAPALVLLHAYTSHARSWDTFAKGMADRFRVLALDQRGHGESEWALNYHELCLVSDLAAFVDALGLETLSLVGFSIGGYAACAYALLYPRHVQRLVLAECFVEDPAEVHAPTAGTEHIRALRSLPTEFSGAAEAVSERAAAAYRPLAPFAEEDELRRWMLGGLKPDQDDRWTLRYDPVLRAPGPPGRLNAIADVFQSRLAKVTTPTLLVAGEGSFHANSAQRDAAKNRGKRLEIIPQAGHWVPLDNPAGFFEAVRGFLLGDPDPDEAELAYAEF